ncbi:MAG: hypothetical protein RL141_29 [Candidatus Parcubacteria bacterium]|jgi:large subunit ribosomal protein L13
MSWNTKQRGMPRIIRETHVIDADGKVVGRLATQVARLLMGKHKPGMVPHQDHGDVVHVLNISKVALTGKKWEQKQYFRSSNRPGGVKSRSAATVLATDPAKLLQHAVSYMLPKNTMRVARLKRLKISA